MIGSTREEIAYDFRIQILGQLRNELSVLKTCQNQMIFFGLTGSGIILTLIDKIGTAYWSGIYLIPLILLLAFWIVFFDKSRTISRITGFLRVIEREAINQKTDRLIGWENAMKWYWHHKESWDITQERISIISENIKHNKNKRVFKSIYWFTVYVVFFLLSLICIALYGWKANILFVLPNSYSLLGIIIYTAIFVSLFLIPYCLVYDQLTKYWTPDEVPKNIEKPNISEDLSLALKYTCTLSFFSVFFNAVFYYYFFPAISLDLLIFWVVLFWFMFFSIFEFWIFFNLVKGRYSYDAFENRWNYILTQNGIKLKENRKEIIAKSNMRIRTDRTRIYSK